jgi:hypothetical protein
MHVQDQRLSAAQLEAVNAVVGCVSKDEEQATIAGPGGAWKAMAWRFNDEIAWEVLAPDASHVEAAGIVKLPKHSIEQVQR